MDERDVKVVNPKRRRDKPDWEVTGEAWAEWLDTRLRWRTWFILGFVVLVVTAGTPHMLVTYRCYGQCGYPNTREFDCDYLGIWGWRKAEPDDRTGKCARFLLM